MDFYIPKFSEMLTSINANVDLDQNNIINKMKDMVQEKYPGLYREWQDNGFDINHLFSQKFTLLHMAARCGFQKVTEVLVEVGADINKKESKCGKVPLHLAAENGHAEVVEFFLNKGVSVNVMDKEKNTPLHYAADDGSRKTIFILINKNADPWLKNLRGKTSVDVYTSKYRNGSGYLAQLKKAKIQGNVVSNSTLLLGATMAASIAAINFIVPGTTGLKKWLYAGALYAHASIARSVTYKIAELSAKDEAKKEQDSQARPVTYKVAELSATEEVKKEQDSNMIQGKITLDDVIVPEQVRRELKMICGHIPEKKKAALQMLGCKMPTGYILYGPPGNGKTLIARAIAYEANAKFISVSGSECMQKYAGHSAHYIKDLFKKARENAPCIVFIDEIDAVCTKRSNNNAYNDEERNRIVNQFLHELDGFNRIEGVTVIAATNRLESLDEALIRPGRLSKHIQIPLPDKSLREKILGLYTEKVPMASDVNLAKLADETNGFSGADLENLVNEAKFHVVDRIFEEESEDEELKVTVTMDDFNNVLKRLKSKKVENKQVSNKIESICDIANHLISSNKAI